MCTRILGIALFQPRLRRKLFRFDGNAATEFFLVGYFFLALCSTGLGQGANAVPDKPEFVVEKDVPISTVLGRYHMVVDLGPLPLGKTGVVKLKLINGNQVTFPVDALELGCSCTSAKISVGEISPNSSATLVVTLSTRSASKRQVVTNSLKLVSKDDKSKSVTMALRYSLAGLMTFAGTSYVQEVDPTLDRQTVMIPFLVTEPVRTRDVSFEITPASEGVMVNLVEDEGQTFAKLVFDPVFVTDESMPLTIVARDESRNLSDTLPLLLRRRKYLEITPRTLRFRSEGDEFVSACLLRYRPPLAESKNGGGKGKEGAIQVEASLGSVRLNARTKKIGRGIYRVFLDGSESKVRKVLDAKEPGKVRWRVVTPEKVYAVESLLSVDSFVSVSPNQGKR